MNPAITGDSNSPAIGVFQMPGRKGGIVCEALLQEGIAFREASVGDLARLFSGQMAGTECAIVCGLPSGPDRKALRQWVSEGGSAVLLGADLWPPAELEEWFGLQRTSEDLEGGYLWPSSPEFAIEGLANEPLQLCGSRGLYRIEPGTSRTLALGSAHPSAAVAFDAIRDGFSDDEWFWVGQDLCRYARGRSILETFEFPGVGPVTPNAAAAGDFTGDGFQDNLIIAKGPYYSIWRMGLWTDGGEMPYNIRHILSYNAGGAIWPIHVFLEDGSIYVSSYDGGKTWGSTEVFAPDGVQAVNTELSYSYEYINDSGVLSTALNVWSQGTFYTNFGTDFASGWTPVASLPDLGPKYLAANVVAPSLGYASDSNRIGLRDQIALLVQSNLYARDPATGGFNYPQQFHRTFESGRHPLVVRNDRAIAFLYDFDRTVLQLQQGLDHDPSVGVEIIKITGTGEPVVFSPVINVFDDWIDYCQLDLPQADLHERLLRQAVTELLEHPLPRIWYLPSGFRSVASLSHDVETSGPEQTAAVAATSMTMGEIAAASERRNTFFVLMTEPQNILSQGDVNRLLGASHEVTLHFDSLDSTDFTEENLAKQMASLRAAGADPLPGTRSHGLSWVNDLLAVALSSQAEMIYDSTFGGGPGYSHCGSVLPYRIFNPDGRPFDSFHEISHGLMDIADMSFFFSGLVPEGQLALDLDDLFSRARDMALKNDQKFYGIFDCLFHPVVVAGLVNPVPEFVGMYQEYVEFLAQQGIPAMTLSEAAAWWNVRRGLWIGSFDWKNSNLGFTISAESAVEAPTIVLARQFRGQALQELQTEAGDGVELRDDLLDGKDYALAVLPQLEGSLRLRAVFG
ncbi:MAG: hypothetical protein ACRD7E_12670 [Bryobacteraceae bacterium]